jgi:phosphoesterase RecJ-like protein
MSDALARAATALAEATTVAIACHVNPDADALGSTLGLSNALRASGKDTVCSFPNEPFDPPRWVSLLPGTDALVPPREFPKQPPVMVTCDVASMDRLGMLAPAAVRATTLVWIDHHVSNDGLGTIPLIDPRASSTAEIVWRLLKEMGGEIPLETAICLYAGVVTDTGRFQYEAVTPDTLRLGA